MIGSMERNVGGLIIYRTRICYRVLDARVCPFKDWGVLPLTFNVHQPIGQLRIFFLAHESRWHTSVKPLTDQGLSQGGE